jgi:thiosulfate/3-mercaptopyruvate sulfurtransferase
MAFALPLIIEADQLSDNMDNVLIVDLSQPATYVQYHVPGAIFLDYSWIVRIEHPRMGLLPSAEQLSNVLGAIGLTPDTHVVVYDDEGGGRACRFLWTLDCVGHQHYSLLNGGLQAWANSGHEVSSHINWPTPSEYHAQLETGPVATRQYILDNLAHDDVVILDTRSPAEYSGAKVFAARGGHIPGAINIEWTEAMDKDNNLRLKSQAELQAMLEARGITRDKTVVTHCQTHHRSAHTYIMLKSLGYQSIKGYPGSWSDWGNEPNTPVD